MNSLSAMFEHLPLWKKLIDEFSLTLNMQYQLSLYIDFLLKENESYDLTAHNTIESVLSYHIEDALWATKKIDWSGTNFVVDVGSGCGIPGIVLAIIFPEKKIYLMEILKKRVVFLSKAIELLKLENCFVLERDFKSFVRKGDFPVDLFCARASLAVEELLYLYGGASQYPRAQILYWASALWQPTEVVTKKSYFKMYEYDILNRQRFYSLFTPKSL